ncbi:hypothetical protein [Halostella sp. PRR32]|uniref:hypothetical protein n=1 Tax=Halostella sp. PRR32 TaxID=3098147 RepID=UPI002B1E16BA|nr:hypothetical protein [Halostella sp. PRR32]
MSDAEKGIDAVYADRNLLALSLADLLAADPDPETDAGWYLDPDTDGWPVIWIDLPTGQASWHVPPERRSLLERSTLDFDVPVGGYDRHTRDEKNGRLTDYLVGRWER